MNKFKDTIRKVLQEGDIVPFGSNTSKWLWTTEHHYSNLDEPENEPQLQDTQKREISLPDNQKLRSDKMKKLMQVHSDGVNSKYNDVHDLQMHPDSPIGRNHGSLWVQKDDDPHVHEFRHLFEKA
jgi:hypothetical protein